WLARCRYNAVLDAGPFWRDLRNPWVSKMVPELHRRGIKICMAFSIECGGSYIDTMDPKQMDRFHDECETALRQGCDMLEVGFGDIPGSVLPSEKTRFKDQYAKGIFLYEEAAKIAARHHAEFQIDPPFYYTVGGDPHAIDYQRRVAASLALKAAFYINT